MHVISASLEHLALGKKKKVHLHVFISHRISTAALPWENFGNQEEKRDGAVSAPFSMDTGLRMMRSMVFTWLLCLLSLNLREEGSWQMKSPPAPSTL